MKKIKYEFADGIKEIEVTDECAEVYANILLYGKKVERKETRRHVSYDALIEAGFEFEDEEASIERVLEKQEQEADEVRYEIEREEREEKYLAKKLKWLESKLTPKQAKAYCDFHYGGLKKVEIAELYDVTEGAVRKLILKAEANLEKFKQQALAEKKERRRLRKLEERKRMQEASRSDVSPVLQSARDKAFENQPLTAEENEALNLCLLKALFGE